MSDAAVSEYERFWSLVDIRDQRECWPWMGAADLFGYGVPDTGIQIAFHEARSHRVACAIMRTRPFADADALHSCDNQACCNPRHLRWGTAIENNEDLEIATWARIALDARRESASLPVLTRINPDPNTPTVFRQGLRKLDVDKVRAIRAAFDGGMSVRDIAIKYGLSQPHADSVAKRRIWKSVA